jgi:hypothetical protein
MYHVAILFMNTKIEIGEHNANFKINIKNSNIILPIIMIELSFGDIKKYKIFFWVTYLLWIHQARIYLYTMQQ